MKRLSIILGFFILLLSACNKPSPFIPTDFSGTWKGTYTGADDNGTFEIEITKQGHATGSVRSLVFSETFQLVGSVNSNGILALTYGGASSGGTFAGTMIESRASGTWENKAVSPPYKGTWTATKQ